MGENKLQLRSGKHNALCARSTEVFNQLVSYERGQEALLSLNQEVSDQGKELTWQTVASSKKIIMQLPADRNLVR